MSERVAPQTKPARRALDGTTRRPGLWLRRVVVSLFILSSVGIIAGGAAAAAVLWHLQRTPREWAPYLQHRADGHRPIIVTAAALAAQFLLYADRPASAGPPGLPPSLGASAVRSGAAPAGSLQHVASLPALIAAIGAAKPGDVIELLPGRYAFSGYAIGVSRPGTAAAPITLRAARLGTAVIESDAVQVFAVSAPFWRFENLVRAGRLRQPLRLRARLPRRGRGNGCADPQQPAGGFQRPDQDQRRQRPVSGPRRGRGEHAGRHGAAA